MKWISESVSKKYETDSEIRFTKKIICETNFGIRFRNVWNGFQNPFHKKKLKFVKRISESVSEMYETDSEIRFTKKNCETDCFRKVWNGFQIPFQKSMKRIPKSVSRKKIKICETDFGIRFILFWNRLWNPFHKKYIKICKTDIEIRFRKIWNGFRNPFLKKNWN